MPTEISPPAVVFGYRAGRHAAARALSATEERQA